MNLRAVCLREYWIKDAEDNSFRLVRGKTYEVSRPRNGIVSVYCEPMVTAPSDLFGLAPERVALLKRQSAGIARDQAAAILCALLDVLAKRKPL